MATVSVVPSLLTGFNTTIYSQPTIQSATPVAWTTANSPVTLFTVTGAVRCCVFGVVGATAFTSTAGTGTLAVGTPTAAALFLAASTANNTTNFVANAVWLDATPTVLSELLAGNTLVWALVNTSLITLVVATNNMTAGAVTMYCLWVPVSAGATVV